MEDEKIIDLLWQRCEAAIELLDRKYGGYCFSIANRILNDRRDAEECVSDTYLAAWNQIPPHPPRMPFGISGPDHPESVHQPLAQPVRKGPGRRGNGSCPGRAGRLCGGPLGCATGVGAAGVGTSHPGVLRKPLRPGPGHFPETLLFPLHHSGNCEGDRVFPGKSKIQPPPDPK